MSEPVTDIPEMDWRELPKSCTGIVIGPPESGKTFLMQFLTYAFKHIYAAGTAACGTEGSQGAFTPLFGELFTQGEFIEEDQIRHAKRQKLCIAENTYPLAIEYIDDCSDDPRIYNTKIVLGSFKNGRQHWKRLYLVGLQYALDMKPSIRKLVSFVCIFPESEQQELEKIYRNFGGVFGNLETFKKAMKILDKNECLIILKYKQSQEIKDCVRWFKAPAWKWSDGKLHPYPENFRFGCREFQEWNDTRLDKNYIQPIV